MSRYVKIMKNDIVDGEGVCVSFWIQGCPFHCHNCHNPETWDFNGGFEIPMDIRGQLIKDIAENGIIRNFSVLGGEPLCDENLSVVEDIIKGVRTAYPSIKIYLWTGYTIEQLQAKNDKRINNILSNIDILIDGPYVDEQKDITLKLRGSKNQRILKRGIDF